MTPQSNSIPTPIDKALRQNAFLHKYIMALDHALLWIAALSFAAFFHLSPDFSKAEALLFSTLVAYGAYLCESGLETLKTAVSSSLYTLDFRKAALWKWIGVNFAVNLALSILFLSDPSWIYLVLIILTAGWQKYMDGRIPPRLQATRQPLDIR
ncbi:MAG: hypothetical protein K2G41_04295 [Duncaniella sp.]|uniref:hypothetical protein n=1 Tax=Duncaniella sp. TaxID=2518496 RepID=UPI0023C49C70|nr:hypothetical protein [Duncaniella sp.]MDE6089901.1 hypothetical protein [Duncaniella sp.]